MSDADSEAQRSDDAQRSENAQPGEDAPFLQQLYDRPFVLLALGLAVMLILFTGWGLWEVATLPEATLP